MENVRCVLCGQEISPLSQSTLSFCGTSQVLCPDCDRRYKCAFRDEREELEGQILASPHLAQRDTVLANLPPHLAAAQDGEATQDRRCPSCGAALECKLENFSIGADGGGGLMSLLCDQYDVDLYACPQCGRVELYTANFVPPVPEWKTLLDTRPQEEPAPQRGEEKAGRREFKLPWRKEKPPWEG